MSLEDGASPSCASEGTGHGGKICWAKYVPQCWLVTDHYVFLLTILSILVYKETVSLRPIAHVCCSPGSRSCCGLVDEEPAEEVVSTIPLAHRWLPMVAECCLVTRGLNGLFAAIRDGEDRSFRNPTDVRADFVSPVLASSMLAGLTRASIVRSCPLNQVRTSTHRTFRDVHLASRRYGR